MCLLPEYMSQLSLGISASNPEIYEEDLGISRDLLFPRG